MTLYYVDNFLSDFDSFRDLVDTLDFSGEVNPLDGVEYPDISTAIPPEVLGAISSLVCTRYNVEEFSAPFIRRSLKGVIAPHQAHSDRIMGTHSVMFYLTRDKHIPSGSGTALLKHNKSNIAIDTGGFVSQVAFEDTNKRDKWTALNLIEMKENRICIFDANQWHRAEPLDGFGSNNEDGRIVLTWFFTGKEKEHDRDKRSNYT